MSHRSRISSWVEPVRVLSVTSNPFLIGDGHCLPRNMPSPGPSCAAVAYVAGFVRAPAVQHRHAAQPIVEVGSRPRSHRPVNRAVVGKGVPFIRADDPQQLVLPVAIGARCQLTQPAPLPITAGLLLTTCQQPHAA